MRTDGAFTYPNSSVQAYVRSFAGKIAPDVAEFEIIIHSGNWYPATKTFRPRFKVYEGFVPEASIVGGEFNITNTDINKDAKFLNTFNYLVTIKSANKVVKHIVDGPTGTFMGTRTVDAFIDSPISDFEPIPVKDFAITYGFHSDYFTRKNLFIARDQTIQPHDYQKRFFSYTIPTLRKVTGKSKLYVFDAATAAPLPAMLERAATVITAMIGSLMG